MKKRIGAAWSRLGGSARPSEPSDMRERASGPTSMERCPAVDKTRRAYPGGSSITTGVHHEVDSAVGHRCSDSGDPAALARVLSQTSPEVPSPLRRGLLVAGLAATSGLTACASNLPVDERRTIPPGQGAILLRLVTDGQLKRVPDQTEPADFADDVLSAVVVRTGPKQSTHRVRLMRLNGTTHSSVVMAGFAEPGQYHVAWIEDRDDAFILDPELLKFEVTANTLSLLGTLVVEKVAEQLTDVGHVPADVEAEKIAIGAVPALWPLGQAGRIALPTNGRPRLLASQERARRFKAGMQPLPVVEQLGTGEFASRGRLGKFYLRPRRRSRAVAIDSGTWGELTSVCRYRGGLVVAGEDGLLRFSSDDGQRWAPMPSPMPGLIRLVLPLRDGGLVAVVRYGPTWSVHVADDPWRTGWRKTAEFTFRESRNVAWPAELVLAVGEKVGVMHRAGSFALVEPRSGQVVRSKHEVPVTTLNPVGSVFVTGLSATPDGLLTMRARRVGIVTLVSADEGRTWTDLNLPRSLVAFTLRDRRVGHAIGVPDGGGQYELLTTRDAGATWVRSGQVPFDPAQVVRLDVDRVDGALLAQLRNDRVMRSMDEGINWTEDL